MSCRFQLLPIFRRYCSGAINVKYTETQKEKILQVINEEFNSLSSYDISKANFKRFSQWIENNGKIKTLADIESIDGFTEKSVQKLFNSIVNGTIKKDENLSTKIKGQVLHPNLSETKRQSCKSVLAIYITVNSICWTLISRDNYEVKEWQYYGIDYPDNKKMQITNILEIAWEVTSKFPLADVYVMKAEATSLRAAGSDPNNPKLLGVNLQKAQLVAIIVALIQARSNFNANGLSDGVEMGEFEQKVYFLRPTLPFRLYGTLVGNERVSTEQTVENLLQELESGGEGRVSVPEPLVRRFRAQKDLQKDMLGQCLLLALTFMDVCIYRNRDAITKLLKRAD